MKDFKKYDSDKFRNDSFNPQIGIMSYLEELGVFSKYKGYKIDEQGNLTEEYKKHLESTFDIYINLENKNYKSEYLVNLIDFLQGPIAKYIPFKEKNRHYCYQDMLEKGLIIKETQEFNIFFDEDENLMPKYDSYLDGIFPFEIRWFHVDGNKLVNYKHVIYFDKEHDQIIDVLKDEVFLTFVKKLLAIKSIQGK
jgi:hypothetical protein